LPAEEKPFQKTVTADTAIINDDEGALLIGGTNLGISVALQ